MAGNVGRTGSSKINQDSVFVAKMVGPSQGSSEMMKSAQSKKEWFVAVADGHGANGHFVSQYIAQHMPKHFENDKKAIERSKKPKETHDQFRQGQNESHYSSKDNTNREGDSGTALFKNIEKAMVSTFLGVQSKLEKQTQFDCKLSGSTLVTCYCKQNTFIFGNAGDSRAIVIGQTNDKEAAFVHGGERGGMRDNSLVIMAQTRDHKPDLPDEAERILNHYDGQINNTHAQTLVIQAIQGVHAVAPPKPSQKLGPLRVWVHN